MTFLERFLVAIKTLLSSKKVLTALAGALIYIAAKRGIVLSADDANGILTVVAVLIGAMGVQDFGSSKALIEAQTPKQPDTVAIGSVENLKLPPSDPRPAPQGSGIQVKPKDSI